MKKSVKWFIGISIVLVIIALFFFISPFMQSTFGGSSSFYWYGGRLSSNENQLPSVVSFSNSISFFDYRIDESFAPDYICSVDSSGYIHRGCCVQYKVYRNGLLIDSIPAVQNATCLDVSGYLSQGYVRISTDSSNCQIVQKTTITTTDTRAGSQYSESANFCSVMYGGSGWLPYVNGGLCIKQVTTYDVKGGISSPAVQYLDSSLHKQYGILDIQFFSNSYYNSGDSTCYHVDSYVDLVSTPDIKITANYVQNVSFGAPLTFRLNILNNWSYPVKAVLSVKYSTSNFLGSIDKYVNRTIDVPLGVSSQDYSIDLQGFSGNLYVTPSLNVFVSESSFSGLNGHCVTRKDATVWDGMVDMANYCSGVPIANYQGDMFKIDVSPNTIIVTNTNTEVQCCDGTIKSSASICPNNCVVNNTIEVPIEHNTITNYTPIYIAVAIVVVGLGLVLIFGRKKRRRR